MIEVFWDAPYWVHIVVVVVSLLICGISMVDKNGKTTWDIDEVGPRIIILLVVCFFWQFVVVIAALLGVLYIPLSIGILLRKVYLSLKEVGKADDEFHEVLNNVSEKSETSKSKK